jgi:hypothetical protein
MAESKHEQNKDADATSAKEQTAPKSVEHQGQTESQTKKANKPEKKTDKNKAERLREYLERWHISLQLIVPSILSLGVIVLIAVQAWIYSNQLDAMRDQLAEMKESKYLARLDQRAWVAAIDITGVPEIGKPFEITVRVKNSGKTFARQMTVEKVAEVIAPGAQPHFIEDLRIDCDNPPFDAVAGTESSVAILAPNGELLADLVLKGFEKVTSEQLELIKSGDAIVVVHGRMCYRDIFDCPHWTTYCAQLGKNLKYAACRTHNDADANRCP